MSRTVDGSQFHAALSSQVQGQPRENLIVFAIPVTDEFLNLEIVIRQDRERFHPLQDTPQNEQLVTDVVIFPCERVCWPLASCVKEATHEWQ